MDFLKLERERGITISAAAITFNWRTSRINLIDTPGHIDFTIEVERAVRVLDGAVAVFDGVAGVQAQSVTVWRQAARYGVPCIAFVNKMDREGASLDATLDAMRERLNARPLLLQVPLIRRGQVDCIVDVVSLELLRWRDVGGTDLIRMPLYAAADAGAAASLSELAQTELGTASDVAAFLQRVHSARTALIEFVAETSNSDDDVAAATNNSRLLDACFGELDASGQRVDAAMLRAAVRRQLLMRNAASPLLPVLCGTALRNRGVQPLLDAVLDYLPAPNERVADAAALGNNDAPFCALAFKVVHDKQRGLIVWLRVLSGTLDVGQRIVNISRRAHNAALAAEAMSSSSTSNNQSNRNTVDAASIERPLRLMRLDAEDTIDLSRVESGDIAATVG